MGYSPRGMEYQFPNVEPTIRSARPSSTALRSCSLTGYGVRFRTPMGVSHDARSRRSQTFTMKFPSNSVSSPGCDCADDA
jgi:hypothetical protein